jgi:hypothetical protein
VWRDLPHGETLMTAHDSHDAHRAGTHTKAGADFFAANTETAISFLGTLPITR